MQIKVKDTRMHKVSERMFDTKYPDSTSHTKEVPVAEAKLVLIPVKEDEMTINGDDIKPSWPDRMKAYPLLYKGWHYKPILISETEKIEEGDWVWNGTNLFKAGHLTVKESPATGYYKVLALPEHFSPKHLQAIVDGKIKDGDKVLVECESKHRQTDDGVKWDILIKLNSNNHITLHRIEEKTYTREDMIAAYNRGCQDGLDSCSLIEEFYHDDFAGREAKWIEKTLS